MAVSTHSLSLSLSINPRHHHHHFKPHHSHTQTLRLFTSSPSPNPKRHRFLSNLSSSPSSSSSSSSSPPTITDDEPSRLSYLLDPLRSGRFLSGDELANLQLLEGFEYSEELKSGSLSIRAMRDDQLDPTVALLAESFSESMLLPSAYNSVLRFLVKQYLVERRAVIPHAITLLGFFKERNEEEEEEDDDDKEEELAGTVEICFDQRGANSSPPTPTAPKISPYISNMTVKQGLRRRGIGWHLLKASEELISKMTSSSEVYLHCRMIDTAPFNMYTKAGYYIVKTDSILILLMLQRRKHLMCKKLPVATSPLESDILGSDGGLT